MPLLGLVPFTNPMPVSSCQGGDLLAMKQKGPLQCFTQKEVVYIRREGVGERDGLGQIT